MRGSLLALLAVPMIGQAQSQVLHLPLKSQRAEVSQTIGITDISITYHRPLVGGRVIWDSLVPYGKVWRTGANMNTTIAFSDPVTVEGKPLDRGTYGLHMIPAADEWTVIFSKNSTSWGSFTYDQAEDALRIRVRPKVADMHEALTYEFDDLRPSSAIIELLWQKVAICLNVSVDVHQMVLASFRQQLRSLARYTWMSWNDAANYLLNEKIALDTALGYADTSIANEDRFDNEMTRSRILAAINRPADADVAERKALDLGTASDDDQFARDLLAKKQAARALAVFRQNATKHPDEWFVHDGLARAYSAQGKFDDATKEMRVAIADAPPKQKSNLESLLTRLGAKQDISTLP
jgi:tetratricopeptide (TPR) repeat protein